MTRSFKAFHLVASKLHWITGSYQVNEHFSKFGEIADVRMNFNERSNTAFLRFGNPKHATEALSYNKPHVIDGKIVLLSPWKERTAE